MIPTRLSDGFAPHDRIGAAIHRASARTGVDFSYLLGQARIESGLNPTAKARTSSATGLYQFIEQTWLGTVKKHGALHGLGAAADAIVQRPNGRYHVADPAVRRAILDLRKQPEAASAMAAEFAADNREILERKLGRPAAPVDLYLAHFLGAGGATRFLAAHDASPDAPAASILPAAARANRWVFYGKDGSARSFAEIRERFSAKLGGSSAPMPAPMPRETQAPPVRMASFRAPDQPPIATPSAHYARMAYLMLAQIGG